MQIQVSGSTEAAITRLIAVGAFDSPEKLVEEAVGLVDLRQAAQEGLRDVEAGRVVPHDMESIKQQVMSMLHKGSA